MCASIVEVSSPCAKRRVPKDQYGLPKAEMTQNISHKARSKMHQVSALIIKIKLATKGANSFKVPEQRNRRTKLHNERERRNISLSECEWRWKGQPL